MTDVFQAKEKVKNMLREVPGIKGIGITWDDDGQPCVLVNVEFGIIEANRHKIPDKINGIPILVSEVSNIHLE